ncbi:MAG: type 1 glutamine amidotransferase [Planctomycetota bacterium]|jgi:GMP synthase-like glutamine amidotransferase
MAILVFEHSDMCGSDRLGEILRSYGHRLRVVRLHLGEAVPVDLDDVDGVISCGGPQDTTGDSDEWVQGQMEILRAADRRGLPIVGICAGCQLLARALGGTVTRMVNDIEFGWHEVELNHVGREDPVYAGIGWKTMQFHAHRLEVSKLPEGARLLASSSRCNVQAWAKGLRTYGIQYHPEIFPERIDDWIDDDPALLTESGLSRDDVRRQTEQHYPALERLSRRLFESIALFLMPVDRRYQGLVKDLHH